MANGIVTLNSNNSKLAGRVVWSSTSNGSVANSSNVTASMQLRRTDGYTTKGTWTGDVNINYIPESYSNPSTSVGSDWVTMKTITKTVGHNNDGTKKCWISGLADAPAGTSLAGVHIEGGYEVDLDTIPRNSAVSLSKTSFNIGETITINTNRKSENFTHTLRLSIGSLNKTLATNIGDKWDWNTNANQDLYGQVYNVANKKGTIYCDCYSGSNLIGTSSIEFTANAVKSSISSSANWTAGNALTINISRPSNNYTHTVQALVNGNAVATTTNIGTSVTFNSVDFNTNVFKQLAQQNSKTSSIKIITYNGTAEIGSTTITGTVTAPAASTANIPTWTAGNTYTCNITRANSSFTHKVELLVGTTSIFTSTGVGTSISKNDTTFHTSIFTALAQAASKETTVKVITYYNGVQVRSQTSANGTVTAPAASTSTIDNFNIGETKSITITRANPSFTHKVEVYWGDWNKTLSSNAGTNVSWNTSIDASTMYSKIPNATSGVGNIRTTTYYNGVQVRSYTRKSFTAYVTNSNPTFTAFTYKDNNTTTSSLTGNNQLQIQNKSNLILTLTAAIPKNSATINKYIATINGKAYESTSTTINIGAITKAGTLSLEVKAVDSRGLTTSINKNITVVSYIEPSYIVNVTRKNNYEKETTYQITTGRYDLITIDGTNKNAIQVAQYRYKESNGDYGSWKTITLNKSGANFNYSELVGNLDNTKTYIFQTQIGDKLTTITQEFTLKNGLPIMAMRKQVIGINKIPTISKGLDVEGDIKTSSKIIIPKPTTSGDFGIYNSDGKAIIRDAGNTNIVVDATGGSLFLGYSNTTSINILNGKTKIDSNGFISGPGINNTISVRIPKNGIDGYGLTNSDGISIIRDHNNQNVTVDATGKTLFLGYQNTTGINILNGKSTIDSNGNITAPTFIGNLTGNASNSTKAIQDSDGNVINSTYYKSSNLGKTTFKVTQGTSQSTSIKDYWAAMLRSDQMGNPTLPSTNKWWHVISMDWNSSVTNQWISQLALPTQDKGVPYYRYNDASGTDISNSTWRSFNIPQSLYDNSSGTTGTITLSETSANFIYLEIFYGKDLEKLQSVKVYSPNGKSASLISSYYNYNGTESNSFLQLQSKIVKISGTSITPIGNNTGVVNMNYGNTFSIFNNNETYIYKVNGYK